MIPYRYLKPISLINANVKYYKYASLTLRPTALEIYLILPSAGLRNPSSCIVIGIIWSRLPLTVNFCEGCEMDDDRKRFLDIPKEQLGKTRGKMPA